MPKLSLAKVSTAALQQELRRRLEALPKLIAERDELNRQIVELEASAATAEPPKPAKAPGPARRARKAKHTRRRTTLAASLAEVMAGKGAMSIDQATEALLASGYKSASKNPRHRVKVTLWEDERFERVGKGQYAVKA
ncbi:MAG TPA: hypothetical protein PLE19_22420 [Planctomycetota bacterium]|nr:hypothetical protein [Planctomycetota bacterium]HRR82992.1 hypothetical protein [Planctomycetota bacterium]HRT96618.1 hypothetical protein [Planctomycetota bacterium]